MSDTNIIRTLVTGTLLLAFGLGIGAPAAVILGLGALLMLVILFGDNK